MQPDAFTALNLGVAGLMLTLLITRRLITPGELQDSKEAARVNFEAATATAGVWKEVAETERVRGDRLEMALEDIHKEKAALTLELLAAIKKTKESRA